MTEARLVKIEVRQEQTHELVKDLHAHIVGAPGQAGLTERVGKVEQRQSMFAKIFAAVGSAFLALGIWLVKGRS